MTVVPEASLDRIRGVVFDVDGVMTDGTVYIGSPGAEMKRFSVVDGVAMVWCRMLGYELALVSGRPSEATAQRAKELGISAVYQGVQNKRAIVTEWAHERGLEMDEVLYMGDDLIDLPVFEIVGVSVAPANADPEIRSRATYVTPRAGGQGAVRDAVQWLLAGAGRLDEAQARYREAMIGEGSNV